MKKLIIFFVALLPFVVCPTSCKKAEEQQVRLLYWNIQNGMWSDQQNDYENFVKWVNEQKPDICVWAEAESRYITDSDVKMAEEDKYLIENWGELASRYGHEYWYLGGHRDGFPQVITSRWPIENVEKIVGEEPDSVVFHGAGWARIQISGNTLNLVALHTWPQRYSPDAVTAEEREISARAKRGDFYRRTEMEYVCRHTIGSVKDAGSQYWMMMGDFNAKSRVDNGQYGYPADTSAFLVHDYVLENTPYKDVVKEMHPDQFCTSTYGTSRIDFVYATEPMLKKIEKSEIVKDEFTTPVRDAKKLSNFYHPSDHLPIIIDFKL